MKTLTINRISSIHHTAYFILAIMWLLTSGCYMDESVLPVPLGTPTKYVKLATGDHHALGIDSDGQLWAWGNNESGQLGDSSTTNQESPVYIGNGFTTITTGSDFSLAIHNDGSLWAWGKGYAPYPTRIDFDFIKVDAGDGHVLALRKDHTLWSWGENAFGQLGDGTFTDHKYPVYVGSGYISIVASGTLSMAVKTDGTLWSWGKNSTEDNCESTIADNTYKAWRHGEIYLINEY